MEEREQGTKYKIRVEKVINQFWTNRESLPTSRVMEKILRSLIDDFENIVSAIEESKDLLTLLVKELVWSLEAHKQRKRKN